MKARWQISIAFAALWMLPPYASAAGANAQVGTPPRTSVAGADIETEVIILTPHGFLPKKLALKPGRVRLEVRNSTHLPLVDFSIEDDRGERTRNFSLVRGRSSRWLDVLELGQGTYTLRLTNSRSETVTIVVSGTAK